MRIAFIADTHLSGRSPECVANWHAARRAVGRLGADLTVNLGDITSDGQTHVEELAFASRLMQQWPTIVRCVPGNHDLGAGSGESPLDELLLRAYENCFGFDHWALEAGAWKLLGINAQLLGTDSAQESALWEWLAEHAGPANRHAHTALFLHRPLLGLHSSELARRCYVSEAATELLLRGPLQPILRLVVSGHTHQYLDTSVDGVRHLWMPSTAFVLPDDMQTRIGEKLVGIGLLEVGDDAARFDLWCPDGMKRHDVDALNFFNMSAEVMPADAKTLPAVQDSTV